MAIRIEVITTGDELLDGRVLNSNLTFLGHHCHTLGLSIQRHTTVGDSPKILTNLFKERAKFAEWILITGGLGPTDDDRTTACVAEAFNIRLEKDLKSIAAIEAYYTAKKIKNPTSNLKQAYFPQGATILENPIGTAPGFLLKIGTTSIVVMPGVPSEMKQMFLTHIYPRLHTDALASDIKTVCTTLKCAGVGESALADALKDLYPLPEEVELGYRAQVTEVQLQLIVKRPQLEEATRLSHDLENAISKRCKDWLFPASYENLTAYVIDLLRKYKKKLAIAESCTGGLLASWIVKLPNVSDVFDRGVVAYDNAAKQEILGISPQLLEQYGAVSEETARAMLKGLEKKDIAVGVSITGIAGPTGGTSEKPVGTVCIGVRINDTYKIQTIHLVGDRIQIQQRAAASALVMLFSLLKTYP